MPLKVDIDHQKRFVTAIGEGAVTMSDVLAYYEAMTEQEESMRYPKLFDASDCHMELSSDDLMTLGAWTRAFAEHDPRGPIAIVANTAHNENVMRGYMAVAKGRRALKLFKTRNRALKWLMGEAAP